MKKNDSRHWLRWFFAGAGIALVTVVSLPRLARSTEAPRLTIGYLSNNVFQLTITNAGAGLRYAIERRESFSGDPSDFRNYWIFKAGGTTNQTNFVVDEGIFRSAFYRALTCTDCDNDWVEGDSDANDNDPNIRELAVTIDDPADRAQIP